jgi:ubiquinone/menaquinone biosynthesis C-methylase UbiE
MNMKGRESGMPDEACWASFFEADVVTDRLLGTAVPGNIIEFGCGYGSFTVPAARRTTGRVTALDIEPEMVDCVRQKAVTFDLPNIQADVRDFVAQGTGVHSESQAHAMIFNLLHLEHPVALLREAFRTLQDGGVLSVIHWRSDIPTPRGPSLAIRPTPEQCQEWIAEAGFHSVESVDLHDFCRFHFGLLARR